MKYTHVAIAILLLTAATGCGRRTPEVRPEPPLSMAGKHCVNSGYQYVQESDNLGLCVNPANNRKCEAWRFQRGECSL